MIEIQSESKSKFLKPSHIRIIIDKLLSQRPKFFEKCCRLRWQNNESYSLARFCKKNCSDINNKASAKLKTCLSYLAFCWSQLGKETCAPHQFMIQVLRLHEFFDVAAPWSLQFCIRCLQLLPCIGILLSPLFLLYAYMKSIQFPTHFSIDLLQ